MPLGQALAPHLPFLRRFARALSGSQLEGDAVVKRVLERIVAVPEQFPRDVDPRLGLYSAFLRIWDREGGRGPTGDAIMDRRLALITPTSRQALLLTTMEGFTPEDAGYLMACGREEVERLASQAFAEIDRQTQTSVLIIEDEPMIAMDLEQIVEELGHSICGIAVTHRDAVLTARERRPGLVLADVQLADDSSGVEAVKEILADFPVPVIFITAFPERLLTGKRPEPAFLITKPFQRSTIRATISQALLFDRATVPA